MRILATVLVTGLLALGAAALSFAARPAASTQSIVRVKLSEMKVVPQTRVVHSGQVTFIVQNVGTVEHEMVLVRTARPLAVRSYKAVEPESAVVGEVEDIEPGKSGKLTATLTPGKYILLCNIVGHYQLGMVSTLTVS